MSNSMAAHEPINYLDSILNEEEMRCEYGHQWRNFSISRSGRFKSKNKKRDAVDGKLFDVNASTTAMTKDAMSGSSRYMTNNKEKYTGYQTSTSSKTKFGASITPNGRESKDHSKGETYKSFYETKL